MLIYRMVAVILMAGVAPVVTAAEASAQPLVILGGSFGRPDNIQGLDIAPRLRQLCADAEERCDVYCSPTSFGHRAPGWRPLARGPVCRATWRCADGNVRSIEAAREEAILIRCTRPARIEPVVDELSPPTDPPPSR
jgi:hypothetical protein